MRLELVNQREYEPFRTNAIFEHLLKLETERSAVWATLDDYTRLTVKIYAEDRARHERERKKVNNGNLKIISEFRLYFPVRVVEEKGFRRLQARDAGRGAWRDASGSELKLILDGSEKARKLLEGTDAQNA